MKCYGKFITLSDVPNEIALSFCVVGCPLNCKGCSWNSTPNKNEYDFDIIREIDKEPLVSCINFFGGEWLEKELLVYLRYSKNKGKKTCLYTGLTLDEFKNKHIGLLEYLDYLKVGRWVEQLGGLDSSTTNQIFYDLHTNTNLNYLFQKREL